MIGRPAPDTRTSRATSAEPAQAPASAEGGEGHAAEGAELRPAQGTESAELRPAPGTEGDFAAAVDAQLATEAELRAAERIAAIGSWHWIAATDTVTWSDELFSIAGRDPSAGAPSFADHPRLWTPESWGRLRPSVEEALASGTPYAIDLELSRPDGTTRWVAASGRPLRAQDGRIIGLHGVVQDITDRRAIEDALRTSAAEIEDLFNAAPVGYHSLDADGWITRINDTELRWLGYSRDEVVGKLRFVDLLVPSTVQEHEAHFARFTETGSALDVEHDLVRRDGSIFPVALSATAIYDSHGRFIGARSTVSDITDRRQADRARMLLTAVVESSEDAIIGTGADGTILTWNRGAQILYGYTAAEAIGRSILILQPEGLRGQVLATVNTVRSGQRVEHVETVRRHKDGHHVDVALSVWPIRDKTGAVIGGSSVAKDISARKRAVAALQTSNAYHRGLIEASMDGLVTIDADLRITDVNQRMCALAGVERADLIGSPFPERFTDPVAAAGGVRLTFGLRSVTDYVLTLRRPDGREVPVSFNASVYAGPDGVVKGIFASARDVTAARVLEQQLRDAHFYTRSLIESSVDALMTTDPAGMITDVNRQMERLIGRTRAELIGSRAEGHFTDPDRVTEGIKRVLADGRVTDFELTARAADGRETPVSYNASTYFDAAGTLRGAVAAARDITERKRTEQELADHERFIARIAAMTPGLIIVRDLVSGRTMYANRDLAEFLGYPPDVARAMGDAMHGLLHPDDEAESQLRVAEFQSAQDGEVVEHEYRMRDVAGGWRRIHARTVVFARSADGRATQVLSVGEDVTDRRRVEEALLAREEQLAIVARNSPLTLWALDRAGQCTLFLGGGAQALGFADDRDLVGLSYQDLFAARPEMQERVRRVLAGETISGDVTLTSQVFTTHNMPVRDAADRIVGAIGMTFEVTNERRLEADLAEARKLEAIGRLAGGVAHDFNNLLTAIAGYAQLVRADMTERDPRRADVDQIVAASDRAADLVRQLLAFGRRAVVSPVVLGVDDVVRAILPLLHRVIGEDIELDHRPLDGSSHVRIDRGQLEQVLVNLVANARDAMPSGGRVVIETSEVMLDHAYAAAHPAVQPGRYVLVAVSDTGAGIDATAMAHVFEPFFTTKATGTGLGLATVHGIVRQAGGTVVPSSEPGRGSTFRVYLPATTARLGGARAADGRDAAAGGTETILVVEDERAVRDLVMRDLEARGYRVLAAADGREALAIVTTAPADLAAVITDVVLPGLSGPDLAAHVAALRPGTPIVMVSGYAEQLLTRRGSLGPATAFLAKPFAAEDLARTLRGLLDAAAGRHVADQDAAGGGAIDPPAAGGAES